MNLQRSVRRVAVPLLVTVGWLPALPAAADPAAASKVVESLQNSIITAMKKGTQWSYEERFKALEPVVDSAYHFPAISQIVLGAQWKPLTPAQQKNFIAAFTALAVAQMADKFDSHSGQQFVVTARQPIRRGQVMIRTVMKRKSEDDIRFDYVLAPISGKWRIVNVVVDGVSDLAVKRAEYQKTIKSNGFDALMRDIRSKINAYGGWPGR